MQFDLFSGKQLKEPGISLAENMNYTTIEVAAMVTVIAAIQGEWFIGVIGLIVVIVVNLID